MNIIISFGGKKTVTDDKGGFPLTRASVRSVSVYYAAAVMWVWATDNVRKTSLEKASLKGRARPQF